jgi:hypothetical protein
MSAPSPWQVERAFQALSEARARLLAIAPDLAAEDEQAYLDNLEGEADGDPLATIDALVRASLDAADFAALAAGRMKALAERRARFERREERLRAIVQDMLTALDLKRFERPDYSATIRAGSPHVVVTDVDALPPQFQRLTVTADKTAIGTALKLGDQVPGAELSNSSPSLSIRVR